jgi:hypothetical protein
VDGALLDNFRLAHGFYEAKDIRACRPFSIGLLVERYG